MQGHERRGCPPKKESYDQKNGRKGCPGLRVLSEGFLEEASRGLSPEGIKGVVQVKKVGEGCTNKVLIWEKKLVHLGNCKYFRGWSGGQTRRGKQGLWYIRVGEAT